MEPKEEVARCHAMDETFADEDEDWERSTVKNRIELAECLDAEARGPLSDGELKVISTLRD